MAETVIGTIAVAIKAKNEALINGLKQANTSVKNFGTNFAKDFGAIAAIGVAAGAAVFAALKSTVDSAAESEKAQNALAVALRNAGDASLEALDDQKAYAEALQATTTFSNDQIMGGQALLAQYGLTGEALKGATRATLNLATAKGMDLKAAVDLVGKGFLGETSMLKRYGIVIDESIPKSERFGAVIAQMQEKFGGSAVAERATFLGQMKAFNNAFDDLKKEIGMVFLPVFTKVAKAMTDFFETRLVPAIATIKEAITQFGGLGNTLKIVGMQMINFNGVMDSKIAKMQAAAIQSSMLANTEASNERLKAQAAAQAAVDKENAEVMAMIAGAQSKIALKQDEAEQMKEIQAESEKFTSEMQKVATERETKYNAEKVKMETETRNALTEVARISEESMTAIFAKELDSRAKYKKVFSILMNQLQAQITSAFIANQARETAAKVAASRTQVMADKPAIASGFFKAHSALPFVGQAIALTFIAAAFGFIDRLVKFNKGGVVPGSGNSDTVPAMLTPGERVLTKAQNAAFEAGRGGGGGGIQLVVNIQGQFLEASPAAWRDLFNEKILPEIRRSTMIQPTGNFIRRRGAA